MKKLPISVLMVIHNEEALIERAILSCSDLADEIIIVHDGKCMDKSLDIAKKYTNKIFELPYVGEAERHRPFSYAQAKNDWILQLDADENLSGELHDNLEKLISCTTDIFDVSWSTFHKDKHYFWFYKRVLFRKSKVYFIGVSHESAKPAGKETLVERIEFSLFHEPLYDNSTFATFRKKWKKWAQIHAGQLLEDFASIPKWNCDLDDWEPHRRLRIDHPIALGMVATNVYNSIFTLKSLLKHKHWLILKLGLLGSMYHFYLYYYLAKMKRNEKKHL